jgi:hypothetical protein
MPSIRIFPPPPRQEGQLDAHQRVEDDEYVHVATGGGSSPESVAHDDGWTEVFYSKIFA